MNEEEILRILGSNLRSIRERRGISAQDIADILNISTDAVRKYERGERDPGIARIITAQSALGCSIMTILSGLITGSESGQEYNVLSTQASAVMRSLATSWSGDIDALIIFMGMLAVMPEPYRREIYLAGTVLKDDLLAKGIMSASGLPDGIAYMERQIGKLYSDKE